MRFASNFFLRRLKNLIFEPPEAQIMSFFGASESSFLTKNLKNLISIKQRHRNT
jgi:hypothetical protein